MRPLALLSLFVCAVSAISLPEDTQFALGTAPHTASDKWSYTDCGEDTNPVKIKSIEVSPDPPEPGKNLTVTVKGTATETLEEGAYAKVVVKLGRIKLLQKEVDLCEEARNAGTSIQCPVEPGDYEVVHTVELPKEIPRAKFVVDVQGYTVDDDDLVCLQLKIDFMKRPFLW